MGEKNPSIEIPLGADVLYKLSAELVAHLDEKTICKQVTYRLSESLGYDFVAIFLKDEITQIRHLVASAGFKDPATPLHPGQGISEQPFLDGKLQYTPDVTKDERYFYGSGGSEVDVPIWVNDQVVGVIIAEKSQKNAFSQIDFDLLTAVSQITGLTLEKARLFVREHKRNKTLEALSLTMTELTAVRDLQKLLKTILVRAVDLIGATGGQLSIYEPELDQIRIVVSHNLKQNYVGTTQKIGQGLMGRVASTRKPMILENYMEWEGRLERYISQEEIYSAIAVPLMIEEQLLGVFTTSTSDICQRFDQDDLYILQLFAQQAALAVDFTSLYEKSRYENQERIRLYDQVARQKEYYEALLIYSPSAIVTGDLQGNIISWNPMAENLFGYRFEEVVGKPLNDFVANHPDIREEAEKYTTDVFTDGKVVTTTKRTRKDGTFVDVELLALPIKVFGEIIGFIALYHDLTELKAIERALKLKNELMSRQLILAGEIQTSFLPKPLPACEGWQISAQLKPALETSGDFYDIRVLPNGDIIFLVADVIDKGVGAALFMSFCWSLLRLFGNTYPHQPGRLFEMFNHYILTGGR
ncbi:MAG: GAF domain-containing protein [Anaerolineales bacterium]